METKVHKLDEDKKKLEEENKALLSQVKRMTLSNTASDWKDD